MDIKSSSALKRAAAHISFKKSNSTWDEFYLGQFVGQEGANISSDLQFRKGGNHISLKLYNDHLTPYENKTREVLVEASNSENRQFYRYDFSSCRFTPARDLLSKWDIKGYLKRKFSKGPCLQKSMSLVNLENLASNAYYNHLLVGSADTRGPSVQTQKHPLLMQFYAQQEDFLYHTNIFGLDRHVKVRLYILGDRRIVTVSSSKTAAVFEYKFSSRLFEFDCPLQHNCNRIAGRNASANGNYFIHKKAASEEEHYVQNRLWLEMNNQNTAEHGQREKEVSEFERRKANNLQIYEYFSVPKY